MGGFSIHKWPQVATTLERKTAFLKHLRTWAPRATRHSNYELRVFAGQIPSGFCAQQKVSSFTQGALACQDLLESMGNQCFFCSTTQAFRLSPFNSDSFSERQKKISLPEVVFDHSMRNQQLRGSTDHHLLWFGEAPSCVCKTEHHQCPVMPGLHSYFARAEYLEKSLFINLRAREESTLAKGRKDNVYRKAPLI